MGWCAGPNKQKNKFFFLPSAGNSWTSVVDQNTLNLDPDTDPDPGLYLCYQL